MSCRVSTASLIAGACVVGNRGLGVLGSVIRSETATGVHGAGYLYNDWQAGDDAKEFRGLIVSTLASGTFFAYENGSFNLTGAADGAYSFVYRLYVDGADLGTATASVTIGTPPALAPSNTVLPTITGSAVQGSTLTASTGTWVNGVVSYAYRWLRGATAISGATESTYVLQAGDVGSQIRVGVIASNAAGSSSEALSAQTAVVTAIATTAQVISGPFTDPATRQPLPLHLIEHVVILSIASPAIVLSQTNLTTDASARLTVADAALTAGTNYLLLAYDAIGSNLGVKRVTAAAA